MSSGRTPASRHSSSAKVAMPVRRPSPVWLSWLKLPRWARTRTCALPFGARSGRADDQRLGARHHRHAVVAAKRIGDHRRSEILLHGQRRAIDRVRILAGPAPLRDGDVAVVGFLQAVGLDLARGDQRIDAVRPAVAERRQVLLRHGVVVRRDLGVAGQPGGVAAEHQDGLGRAALDAAERMAEHVHRRRAAVGVLQNPAQRQAELPGEVDGGVGGERERRHRQALDVGRAEAGIVQRRHHGVAHEMQRGLSRLRTPRVGRLADADDGGVFEHGLSSLPPQC